MTNIIEQVLKIRNTDPKHFLQNIKKELPKLLPAAIEFNFTHNIIYKTKSQAIYNYIYNFTSIPTCKSCNTQITSFGGNYTWCYPKFCSIQCMAIDKDTIYKRTITTINKKRSFSRQNEEKLKTILESDITVYTKEETNNIVIKLLKTCDRQNLKNSLIKHDHKTLKSIYYHYPELKYKKFSEILLTITNKQPHKCIFCNNDTPFINFQQGYKQFCGIPCANAYTNRKRKEKIDSLLVNTNLVYDRTILKEKIKNIISGVDNRSYYETILKMDEILISQITLSTQYLATDVKFNERIHHIINDIDRQIVCEYCGEPLTFYTIDRGYLGCGNCIHGVSSDEKEIRQFITALNPTIKQVYNDRNIINPYELDIFLPDYKLAIEYNGVYWHSVKQRGKSRNCHLNKTQKCVERGIKLIQIFSNEWKIKPDIIKSIIKSKLNIFDNRIFARKCIIKEVTKDDKKQFLNENHLQGNDNSQIRLGLYYDNLLVSLMTFGYRKITKTNSKLELIRFCTKLNTQVIGGASKLLSHFEKIYNPKTLTTYCDKRYGGVEFYQTLGFTLLHESKPNYWYFKSCNKLENRIKYQKYKLKILLPKYNEALSEWENMEQNGFNKIWDCGNYVFIKNYNN